MHISILSILLMLFQVATVRAFYDLLKTKFFTYEEPHYLIDLFSLFLHFQHQ